MKANLILDVAAAAALLAVPAQAAEPVNLLAPEPRAPAPATGCEGAAEEKAALEAERRQLDDAIGDLAMGRRPKVKTGVSGGEVARRVAGTAASILLPFPLGVALNAGAGAAAKGGRKGAKAQPPAGPSAETMIDRLAEIEERQKALAGCG